MAIAERIYFFRNLRGMTQKVLGKLVGFSENTADVRLAQYEDAKDIDFPLWHFYAGTLRRNPKFYDTLNAYANTLRGNYERVCFFLNAPLSEWEEAMRT